MLNSQVLFSFSVAAVFGAAIWGMSPIFTQEVEPWDAESPYYFAALFIVGGLGGLLFPRHILAAFLGIVVGQLTYMLVFLPLGPLVPLGIVFLFGYGLFSFLGLLLASRVCLRLGHERVGGDNGT